MKYLLKAFLMLPFLLTALTGCKEMQGGPEGAVSPPHGMGAKKNLPVVVPDSVKGKWKAVKITVTEKGGNRSVEYQVPIGSGFVIPGAGLVLTVDAFLPEFSMTGTSLTSVSNEPKNPAAQVKITEAGKEVFRGWLFANFPSVHAFDHPKYSVTLVSGVPAGQGTL
ncbi:MAG: DUF2155 domain-containing protein [Deltaproteobacteria bacterium]